MGAFAARLACTAAMPLAAWCLPTLAAPLAVSTFACEGGPYAAVLPRHYPSLHVIGRHTWVDVSTRTVGATTLTTRRIEYIGMSATVLLDSSAPDRYRLLALDVNSRRWNVGPMSVGRDPWRTVNDAALKAAPRDGSIELQGPRDAAFIVVRGGRIDRVRYQCSEDPARAYIPA